MPPQIWLTRCLCARQWSPLCRSLQTRSLVHMWTLSPATPRTCQPRPQTPLPFFSSYPSFPRSTTRLSQYSVRSLALFRSYRTYNPQPAICPAIAPLSSPRPCPGNSTSTSLAWRNPDKSQFAIWNRRFKRLKPKSDAFLGKSHGTRTL